MGWVHPVRRACILLAAALAGCAGAGGAPSLSDITPIEKEFVTAAVTWDLNQDGDVTCQEWKQYVTRQFREADANRDGILTRQEFAAMGRSDRLFETVGLNYWDANADGRLSLPEMVDKANPAFAVLDKDGDCRITPEDRRSVVRSGADNPGGKAPGRTRPGPRN